MNRLPLAPPHRAGEPPAAYASRIAAAYGLLAKEFCSDFGIRLHTLVNGSELALEKVASIGGVSQETIAQDAFVRQSSHEFRYRGVEMRVEDLTKGRLDVCFRCLVADINEAPDRPPNTTVFLRAEWCIDVLDTCQVHRTALAAVHKGSGYAHASDFSTLIAPMVGCLPKLAKEAEVRTPTKLQDYVLARLSGQDTGVPFLDAMGLSAAILTCELLGTAACFGRTARFDKLDAASRRTARICGFEIAIKGKSAIEELLRAMTLAYTRRRHGTSEGSIARQAFASLHAALWVYPERPTWRDQALVALRAVVAEFIKENFPLKAGDNALGVPILKRKLHTVTSLASEYGLAVATLKTLLELRGVIAADKVGLAAHHIIIDAEEGDRIVRESLAALRFEQAWRHLGINHHVFSALVSAKLITPVTSDAKDANLRPRYSVAALDSFLADLAKGARAIRQKGPRHVTIAKAARMTSRPQAEICKLILGGKLKVAGVLGGKRDFHSILVDCAAVESTVHGWDGATLSPREFGDRFGLKKGAILRLVKDGCVKADVCKRAGNAVFRIPRSEVEVFRKTFVSLRELRRSLGKHHRSITKLLSDKGVAPVFDRNILTTVIYRRAEVERKLA